MCKFIVWDEDNLAASVVAMNKAMLGGGAASLPGWLKDNLCALGGGPVITIPHLKSHIQTTTFGEGVIVIGNALIAPTTLMQRGNVACIFSYIGFYLFFTSAHTICPIGCHYELSDKDDIQSVNDNDRHMPAIAVAGPILAPATRRTRLSASFFQQLTNLLT